MQIVHIANWCTWLAHTLCKGLIWNYRNCWHSLEFHLGSCKRFEEVENVSGIFFYWCRILFWNFEICTIPLFSFGWWYDYTLMKNKHQISLYLGLTKMVNILQITFSNGFSFKEMSVCLSALSVFLSVPVTHFSLCSPHGIIMKFSGVITNDRSDVCAKFQGERSKVKATEVKTQVSRFETIIPVWFHIRWWNDVLERYPIDFQGHLSNFKVTRLKKIVDFDPNWALPDCISTLNSKMAMKWCKKIEVT